MKKVYLALLLLLYTTTAHSQLETAHWFFGQYAGLDFTSGSPIADTKGQLSTVEGCSSISDKKGNLLFYTDGNTVYNKYHRIMPHGIGLMGNYSSTQSAIIVPHPSLSNIYYIFTVDANDSYPESIRGIHYTTVNMDLERGMGDIEQATKNTPLPLGGVQKSSEKITAVKHADKKRIWVITHYLDTFYAFLIDENGVSQTPVESKIGINIPFKIENKYMYPNNARGYIKTSPNGKKLAIAHLSAVQESDYPSLPSNASGNSNYLHGFGGALCLYDFDNTNGKVSNEQILTPGERKNFYGVEFSPNSKLLYAEYDNYSLTTTSSIWEGGKLVQFNLEAPDISASETTLHTFPQNENVKARGALQLALDKKIYYSLAKKSTLSVINNPNILGTGANFSLDAIKLNIKLTDRKITEFGLPPFITSFFEGSIILNNDIKVTDVCEEESVSFILETNFPDYTVTWDFGDGSPTVSGSNPTHTYYLPPTDKTKKTYTVKATLKNDFDPPELIVKDINVFPKPILNTKDTVITCNSSVSLDAGKFADKVSYRWENELGIVKGYSQFLTVSNSGKYKITVTSDKGCSSSKIINVINNSIRDFKILEHSDCGTTLLTADRNFPDNYSFEWTDANGQVIANTKEINVTQNGLYGLKITSDKECDSYAEIEIKIIPIPEVNITESKECDKTTLEINSDNTNFFIVWTDEHGQVLGKNKEITIYDSGKYYASINFYNGCVVKSEIETIIQETPVITPTATVLCGSVNLNAGNFPDGYSFIWKDANGKIIGNTQEVNVMENGTYYITVTSDKGCENTAEIEAVIFDIPVINPTAQSLCGEAKLNAGNFPDGYSFIWKDDNGKIIGNTQEVNVMENGTYYITVTSDKGCENTAEIEAVIFDIPVINPTAQSLCREAKLNAGNFPNGYSFIWKDANGKTLGNTQEVNVMENGTYYITVTSDKGCENTAEIEAVIFDIPVINPTAQSLCREAKLNAGNFPNGYSFIWKDDNGKIIGNTQEVNVMENGTYYITVTSDKGCENTAEIEAVIFDIPVINPTAQSLCGEAKLNAGNFPNGYSFIWKDANGKIIGNTQEVNVMENGTYYITVTSDKGCENTAEIEAVIFDIPVINPTAQSLCGEAKLNAGNFPNGYSFIWKDDNGKTLGNTQEVSVMENGTYYITVTSDKGCENTAEIEAVIFDIPVINPTAQSLCGEAKLNAGNFPNGYSFIWKDANGKIIGNTQEVNVMENGTYYITVTSDKGCENTAEIEAVIFDIPVINPTAQSLCGEAKLNAGNFPNGYSFIWKDANGKIIGNTQEVNVMENGTYYITVTSDKGCENTAEIEAVIFDIPVINPTAQSLCGEAKLNAGNFPNGYSFIWKDANGKIIGNTQEVNVMENGTYYITVTSDKGCENTAEIEAVIFDIPVINPTAQSLCGEAKLNAGNFPNGYSFIWKDANGKIIGNTQEVNVMENGTYYITVTSDKGCENTAEIEAVIFDIPVINPTAQSLCGEAKLNAGNFPNGYSFIWKDANGKIIGNTQEVNVMENGTYYITVTSDKGCENTAEIEAVIFDIPVINPTAQSLCGEAKLNAGNFPNGYSFIWKDANGKIIGNTQEVNVMENGTYYITVTSDKGCENTAEIEAVIFDIPVINPTAQSLCGEAKLNAGNFPNGYSFIWKDANGKTLGNTQEVNVMENGTYYITVTSDKGCENTAEIEAVIFDIPIPKVSSLSMCITNSENNSVFKLSNAYSQIINNYEKYEISFYLNKKDAENKVNRLPDNYSNISNPQTLYVRVESEQKCTGYSTLALTTIKTTLDIIPDLKLCEEQSNTAIFNLGDRNLEIENIIGHKNYKLEYYHNIKDAERGNNPILNFNDYTGNSGENIIIKATEIPNQCDKYFSFNLITLARPEINLEDLNICSGSFGQLDIGTQPKEYKIKWNTGETSHVIRVVKGGDYSVTVTNTLTGCSTIKTVTVTIVNSPIIKDVIIKNNTAEVVAIGDYPLEYSLDLINWQSYPIFKNLDNGSYKVYVRSKYGCKTAQYPFDILNIPNAITPNGDGFNDEWNIPGLEAYPESRIKIFDRYGKILVDKIFTKNPIWDGKYLGRQVPTTSYWYVIEFKDGKKITGWLLVRNYDGDAL